MFVPSGFLVKRPEIRWILSLGRTAFGLFVLLGYMMSIPRVQVGGVVAVFWSLGFLTAGLQLQALGAFLRLAIHVEENTRATAQCLEELRSRQEPRADPIGSIFRS